MNDRSRPAWAAVLAILNAFAAFGLAIAFFVDGGSVREWIEPLRHNSFALILAVDLLITYVLLLAWVWQDLPRGAARSWWLTVVVATFVGVSSGFGLHLWRRGARR